MRKAALIIALLTATLAYSQEKPGESKTDNWEAANIPVKTLTSEDAFNRLLRLLSIFNNNAKIAGDSQLKTISVYAPKEVVSQIRHLVQDLDKPGTEAAIGRNIEMTLTFLKCSSKTPVAAASLSPEIEPVARQLRAASFCKDVQLWDYVPLHLQEGKEATENLRLPGTLAGASNASSSAEIHIRPDSVGTKGQGRFVRFGMMRVNFRIPLSTGSFQNGGVATTQFTYSDVGINTAGDFMEGQKTVLGKVSGMEEDGSIFVVIALKILD